MVGIKTGRPGIEHYITIGEADKIRTAVALAAVKGLDVVVALHRGDHLLHTRRLRQLQADTLTQAADLLDQCTVKQLQQQGRGGYTPLDTKNSVSDWLRRQAADLETANGV